MSSVGAIKCSPACTTQPFDLSSFPHDTQQIILKAEEYVRAELKGNDGSHDWFHIDRVRKLAYMIAKTENLVHLDVVVLAALLHDIKDWKYSGSETAGADAARTFLLENNYPSDKVELVCRVIANIGFKNELGGAIETFPELAVVQDADRLDAIGAVGIARTFTYGGARNRAIYDPATPPDPAITKESYMKSATPTVNHFYDKLLKLKDLMKTETGRSYAEKRHQFMESFLAQLFDEFDARA